MEYSARVIDSLDVLQALAASRPRYTRTYRVAPDVYRANHAKNREAGHLRQMTGAEVAELEDFLELPRETLHLLDWGVGDVTCAQCGRQMTFTDLANESVAAGRHTKGFITSVIQGKLGQFITVDGTDDDTHVMRCLNCGARGNRLRQMVGDASAYDCAYAYAHCAW